MNKQKISSKFTEIVAMRLNAIDQQYNGARPLGPVTDGWRERYTGIPQEQLPPYTVELNTFRTEVDNFVAMLMRVLSDT